MGSMSEARQQVVQVVSIGSVSSAIFGSRPLFLLFVEKIWERKIVRFGTYTTPLIRLGFITYGTTVAIVLVYTSRASFVVFARESDLKNRLQGWSKTDIKPCLVDKTAVLVSKNDANRRHRKRSTYISFG